MSVSPNLSPLFLQSLCCFLRPCRPLSGASAQGLVDKTSARGPDGPQQRACPPCAGMPWLPGPLPTACPRKLHASGREGCGGEGSHCEVQILFVAIDFIPMQRWRDALPPSVKLGISRHTTLEAVRERTNLPQPLGRSNEKGKAYHGKSDTAIDFKSPVKQ